MESLAAALAALLGVFPYFLEALAIFALGKFVFDLSTPGIDDDAELTKKDNPAFGVFFVGYMLGLAIAIAGSLGNLGPSLGENLADIAISGVAAILLLRLGMILGQELFLRGFRLDKEIVADRNLGAGFAFAGLFVANGLILAGVMSGRSEGPWAMLLDILAYWAAGQFFLALAWFAHRALSRFDVRASIGTDNNAAAGIGLCGFLVAAGIVIGAALTGTGGPLADELLVSAALALAGLLLVSAARLLVSLVLLRKANLSDEIARQANTAAGAASALGYVAVALLFAALVRSQIGS